MQALQRSKLYLRQRNPGSRELGLGIEKGILWIIRRQQNKSSPKKDTTIPEARKGGRNWSKEREPQAPRSLLSCLAMIRPDIFQESRTWKRREGSMKRPNQRAKKMKHRPAPGPHGEKKKGTHCSRQ